jgi:hypothetical protein
MNRALPLTDATITERRGSQLAKRLPPGRDRRATLFASLSIDGVVEC